MKFIVDAQLPKRLSNLLNEKGYDSTHTTELPKGNLTSDIEINEFSIAQKRIVISKDSDFYNRYLTKSEPFKLIIISTGNVSNNELINLVETNFDKILEAISTGFVVEITKESLITIL